MSRRAVLSIAVISLIVLAGAALPWTLAKGGLGSSVASHLKLRYGMDLSVAGRSTFALLPTPRIKFEQVALRSSTTSLRAEGGTLRAEFRILPLLVGRIELDAVSLSDSRIDTSYAALRSQDWTRLIADEAAAIRTSRLVIAGSTLRFQDRPDLNLDGINIVLAWVPKDDTLGVAGSALWRGEAVAVQQAQFQPLALAAGRAGRLRLAATLPAAQLSLDGVAQWGSDPRFNGKSLLKATSVRHFTGWSGLDLPFGSLLQAVAVEGDLSFDRRGLSWPSVAVKVGPDMLEGTLAVRLDGERPLMTGTLAADRIDLSDVVRPLSQTITSNGTWSEDGIDLASVTGSDLDLRLSATSAKLGRVLLGDMAASVLVRPGSIEASLGRGTFYDGTLKGRLSLTATDSGTEFRAQGAFDSVDMAAFLAATGQGRWMHGPGQGQFLIEGTGRTPADIVRRASGRSTIAIKNGELMGIGLVDAVRRVEKRPLAASLNWKGGRTPFDHAQAQFIVADGIAAIADGRLTAPGLMTALNGRISLIDRVLDLKADVSPSPANPTPVPALVFDITGNWQNVIVSPDALSFIQRSGAAQPLFGRPQPLPVTPEALATAR